MNVWRWYEDDTLAIQTCQRLIYKFSCIFGALCYRLPCWALFDQQLSDLFQLQNACGDANWQATDWLYMPQTGEFTLLTSSTTKVPSIQNISSMYTVSLIPMNHEARFFYININLWCVCYKLLLSHNLHSHYVDGINSFCGGCLSMTWLNKVTNRIISKSQ